MRTYLTTAATFALAAVLLVAGTPYKAYAVPDTPGPAAPATSLVKGVTAPSFSPDGKYIAFSYKGDIWVVPAEGGEARRITLHRGQDYGPKWSPDGKYILFSANRGDNNYNVYVTTREGGVPRQLTYNAGTDYIDSITQDGKHVLFTSYRTGQPDLWIIPFSGGVAQRLTTQGGREGAVSPDGKTIVFSDGTASLLIRGYTGSGKWDLFKMSIEGGKPEKLVEHETNDRRPKWTKDGKFLYFQRDTDGCFNVFKLDISTGDIKQITKYKKGDAAFVDVSADGKKLCYVHNFQLYTSDSDGGKARAVNISITSDILGEEPVVREYSNGAEHPTYSLDGKWVTFCVNGDIWRMPSSGGKAVRLTNTPDDEQWPHFSPDGSRILYQSNTGGNFNLYILNLSDGSSAKLTNDPADEYFASWSPDGNEVVYTSDRTGNKEIYRQAIDGGTPIQLTDHSAADDDPSYSPDGKKIVFDSGRAGNQHIFVMDLDGENVRQVTTGNYFDQVARFSSDGRFIVYESIRNNQSGIYLTPVTGGKNLQIANDGSCASFSPDGKHILFSKGRAPYSRVYKVIAPKEINIGTEVPFTATVTTTREEENAEVFDEAWAYIKNGFYDPKFHGVDWDEIKKIYRPLAVQATTKEDLYSSIAGMIGHLRASHLGIYGNVPRPDKQSAYLGIDFGPQTETGSLPVLYVEPGSPADEVWIRPGDYLFAIDGRYLGSKVNYDQLLLGKHGTSVKLSVAGKNSRANLRHVTVTPISFQQWRSIVYRNWEKKSAEFVTKKGKGKVGYIHLSGMMPPDLQKFSSMISGPCRSKKALVLDARNNSGGRIHLQVLEILLRKPIGKYRSREGREIIVPSPYWGKPVILLINERSFSDAELLPDGFRALNCGKIVGQPTPGGVIGTRDVRLLDGSTFRVPSTGWYQMGGKKLEGVGVPPDIFIENTYEDIANGYDRQLDVALTELMKEIGMIKDEAKDPEEKKPEKPEKTGEGEDF